ANGAQTQFLRDCRHGLPITPALTAVELSARPRMSFCRPEGATTDQPRAAPGQRPADIELSACQLRPERVLPQPSGLRRPTVSHHTTISVRFGTLNSMAMGRCPGLICCGPFRAQITRHYFETRGVGGFANAFPITMSPNPVSTDKTTSIAEKYCWLISRLCR